MASFLVEALKGVQAEMRAMGTLPKQLQRLPRVLGILLAEVASLLSLIPYAVSAMQLYRSDPWLMICLYRSSGRLQPTNLCTSLGMQVSTCSSHAFQAHASWQRRLCPT